MKLEKHEYSFPPEKEVTVWMVVVPSDTATEFTRLSTKKYTSTVEEMKLAEANDSWYT